MTAVKFRQLIDVAIGCGYPGTGHVNFYALHFLLSCIAEKMNIIDADVDCSGYEAADLGMNCRNTLSSSDLNVELLKKSLTRMSAGLESPNETGDPSNTALSVDNVTVQAGTNGNELGQGERKLETIPEEVDDVKSADLDEPETKSAPKTPPPSPQQSEIRTVSLINSTASQKGSKLSFIRRELSMHNLDSRINNIENHLENITGLSDKLPLSLSIVKDQLDLVMKQVLLLSYLKLKDESDFKLTHQLLDQAQILNVARQENVLVETSNRFPIYPMPSVDFSALDIPEEEPLKVSISELEHHESEDDLGLSGHVCYSPDKMINMLLEHKAELCAMKNSINDIVAKILEQESQRTVQTIREHHGLIKELQLASSQLKDQFEQNDVRIKACINNFNRLRENFEQLAEEKVNKFDLDILLASKVDYKDLQQKVSFDYISDMQCRIDKAIHDIRKQIKENNEANLQSLEHMKLSLGPSAMEESLKRLENDFDKKLKLLQDLLQKYIDSTNSDCVGAAAKVKVLKDFSCLSCDTACALCSREKAAVPKYPTAYASISQSPVITFNMSTVRQVGLKALDARHAGGPHTTSTACERITKVLLNKQ